MTTEGLWAGLRERLRAAIHDREEKWPLCDKDEAIMRDCLAALESAAPQPTAEILGEHGRMMALPDEVQQPTADDKDAEK